MRIGGCRPQMRIRTGKGGRYLYYACSRKTDIGQAGCSGLAVPMRKLDDIVTEAVCNEVLEPSWLTAMVGDLVARNARHQDRQRAELRELFGKQRELSAQIKNLIDVMEIGGLASVALVRDRLAARQTELSELARVIALKKQSFETAITQVTTEKTEAFATTFRQRLRDSTNPAFRRAYLRLMLDTVAVGTNTIRISGPMGVLAHQLTAQKPLPPSLVPTFVDGWRTEGDKTANWSLTAVLSSYFRPLLISQ